MDNYGLICGTSGVEKYWEILLSETNMLSYCHLKTFNELVAGIQCEVATQSTSHLISEDVACVEGSVSLSPPSGEI